MAAPAFRARTMYPDATTTSITVTVPPTTVAGDVLFVALKVGLKGTITGPAGWEQVAAQTIAAIEAWTCSVFAFVWDGKSTEYNFTWGGSSTFRSACIWSVSGADTTTPVSSRHAAALTENTPASTKATIAAYSVPTNENRPFTVVFNNEGFSVTPAAGYTELGDQADGPQVTYKTEAVNAGELAKVEHTISSAVTVVLGFSVQPPQAATTTPRRLCLLGVGA